MRYGWWKIENRWENNHRYVWNDPYVNAHLNLWLFPHHLYFICQMLWQLKTFTNSNMLLVSALIRNNTDLSHKNFRFRKIWFWRFQKETNSQFTTNLLDLFWILWWKPHVYLLRILMRVGGKFDENLTYLIKYFISYCVHCILH